ncbi:MAG: helix-turn-helix transcriptional regulator [Cytophagales bacterium]|nr:helix-turn-helix transcriptional regulator [Cytophagales bacterium]
MSTLAEHLKQLRVKNGLTQEALADQSNVSLRTIQRIELGQVHPRNSTLSLIFESLGAEYPASEESDENSRRSIKLLKVMNLLIILFMAIPIGNVLVTVTFLVVFFKKKMPSEPVRHMLSFQLLWSLTTLLLFFLGVFISNLVTGNAGNGQYIGLIIYVLCIAYNIYTLLRNTASLNSGAFKMSGPVPNFF